MSDCSIAEIFWALAVLSFPVCMLIFAIIFKNDISKLLERIGSNKLTKDSFRTAPEYNRKHIDKISTIEDNLVREVNKQTSSVENCFFLVEVCKNKNSGTYFIVIDENYDDMVTLIIPNGTFKNLERKLFDDFKQQSINELFSNNLITKEQIACYLKYVENDADNYFENYNSESTGIKYRVSSADEEPDYIKSYRNMLKSQDTWPSRMLQVIAKEESITRNKLKDIIATKYNYSTSDTNGSFHASLRLLLVDGYINVEGFGDNKIIKINHQ